MGYCVYKHTAPNGKCYIGITCQGMERRARKGEGYKECTAFYNAIKKYGWDSFSHEILEDGLIFEDACRLEVYYIQKYNSLTSGYGYNLENGGRVNSKVGEETKRRISKTLTGRKCGPMSEAQRRAISERRKGTKMPPRSPEACKRLSEALKGRKFSAEHCRKISESKKGTYAGANNPRATRVRCVETGKEFQTIKEAGEFTGGSPKNIISACRGRLKTSGGYHWEYVDKEV